MANRYDALHGAMRAAALAGQGASAKELREAVARGEAPEELKSLVEKIRRLAYRVTDEDIDALRARYSEDQLFEVVIAATLGAAEERRAAALRALEGA